jgi:hypothetical protein
MSLLSICEWLAATPASIALHESRYMYLIVLTIHVLTLSLFVGLIIIQSLRLLGFALMHVRASELSRRLLPWALAGFLIMLLSGTLLFYAAPLDKYANLFFRIKIGLLGLAGINIWFFYRTAYNRVVEWDMDPVPPTGARVAGGLSLLLWALVVTAGRMIPYQPYWFS